jgi:hypothetical protein
MTPITYKNEDFTAVSLKYMKGSEMEISNTIDWCGNNVWFERKKY